MLGSLIYILLDVSFNVLIWTGIKTVNGVGTLYYYLTNSNDDENKNTNDEIINMSDINQTNNTNNTNKQQGLTEQDINMIRNQINNQTELIRELKDKLSSLESELNKKKFLESFEEELSKND